MAVAVYGTVLPVSAETDAGFSVQHASTTLQNGVYRLDAEFDLALADAPREALASGVPLYLSIDMHVSRERNWWWDETVAELTQRYRLEFHALSSRYLVINLNTGERHSFRSVGQALEYVGSLRDFPLLDRVLVSEQWRYTGSVHVSLDIGKLPLLLAPGAYFSSQWRLASEDYRWLLK
ncbi:MAG: DUF4390 domain-containing protein [Gammaproteobacteria bacterium]|nr:DUF4390 domain-containing protein [Gammaproteobacteria bacterium]